MTRIGFLGTGVMGVGMARQLIAAGHDLSVFNRTVEKTRPLVEQGARLAITPREAADGADVVFAMVGDDEASEHVWMGALDGALAANLKPGTIVVECSTLSHSSNPSSLCSCMNCHSIGTLRACAALYSSVIGRSRCASKLLMSRCM